MLPFVCNEAFIASFRLNIVLYMTLRNELLLPEYRKPRGCLPYLLLPDRDRLHSQHIL